MYNAFQHVPFSTFHCCNYGNEKSEKNFHSFSTVWVVLENLRVLPITFSLSTSKCETRDERKLKVHFKLRFLNFLKAFQLFRHFCAAFYDKRWISKEHKLNLNAFHVNACICAKTMHFLSCFALENLMQWMKKFIDAG